MKAILMMDKKRGMGQKFTQMEMFMQELLITAKSMGQAHFFGSIFKIKILFQKVTKLLNILKEDGGEDFLMEKVFIKKLMGIYIEDFLRMDLNTARENNNFVMGIFMKDNMLMAYLKDTVIIYGTMVAAIKVT